MGTNYAAIANASSSYLLLIFFFMFGLSHEQDFSISSGGTLRTNETLVSAGGVFELGFFGVPSSGNRYLGIWFVDDPQKRPVWVANRDNPLTDSTCFLQVRDDGNLILEDRRLTPMIVNSGALSAYPNTTATPIDTGNFVLQAGANLVWQSFDYPSDTYLPGMKIGWFGLTSDVPTPYFLSAWESSTDPGHGDFTLGVDYKVANLTVYRGDSAHMDIGYWDGKRIHLLFANYSNSFNFSYFSNPNEAYFTFTTIGNYSMSWLVMASTGLIDEYTLSNRGISMISHSLCEASDFGTGAASSMNNETAAAKLELSGEKDQELPIGYMSPEYAMNGLFSEKSDVFSFGIIVLEIITGKRNVAFFDTDHSSNLLGSAWNLWKEGENTELMDSTLADSCSSSEVLRYIQLGILCVQERAEDRLSMFNVVSMLSNETMALPYPKEPGLLRYVSRNSTTEGESLKIQQGQGSQTVQSVISVISPR
ncbi:hypothetical protein RHSIM_Rhsim02G0196400 [Rhododendron simsii]|uniref:Bulb-type lectin domain-containing protein n=1 Tax=Rhododendron simsii TaxID=118357 RepID=A0A834LW53_RHOSS|nr:hypothetical protein RHSIM_Rhsim02G0196400 [Rhododendron simsii]